MSGVSSAHSKILYGASPHVAADGEQSAIIKVRLRDYDDQPVAGRQAEIFADREDVIIDQPGLTDENGLALAYVRTSVPGPVVITAHVLPAE
jgi:hypothetical protein